jgi:hypothetical protein
MMKKRVPAMILCFIAFVVSDESKREREIENERENERIRERIRERELDI